MIENTTKRGPESHLLGLLNQGNDEYITGMEAQGQRQLVESTDLPTESEWTPDSEYEALGFVFGAPHAHDSLFRPATLPAGWRKVGTDHSMHTDIVDEKGRKRASVFYKAAFYDRRASLSMVAPESVLSRMHWDEEAPTSLPIDDLLTREMAVEWIAATRKHDVEYRDLAAGQGRDVTERDAHLARLDLIESLLPPDPS